MKNRDFLYLCINTQLYRLTMNVKERLKRFISNEGITIREFEERIGVANGYVNSISKSIGVDKINLLIENFPNIDLRWLFSGNGEMTKTTTETKRIQLSPKLSTTKEYMAAQNIVSIPIVDVSAAAGTGYFNPDSPETLGELSWPVEMLHKRSGNYYCGKVNGESMAPTLLYNDFIIFRLLSFDEWQSIKNGEVYFIVNRSGESFVKRIKNNFKSKGSILCLSDNIDKANFRDFDIQGEEIANIYHVEWRFSKDMSNINALYYDRMSNVEDKLISLENMIKGRIKE